MSVYCYLRVSSANGRQHTGSQRSAIKGYLKIHGLKRPVWIEDRMTGRREDRKGYQEIMEKIGSGDVLLVWKLDRLGRSAIDCIKSIMTLLERGVKIVIVSTGMVFDSQDAMSKFIIQLFSALAELESGLIGERVSAGLDHAREKGVVLGAKPKDKERNRIKRYLDRGMSQSAIARKMGVSRQAINNMIKRMNTKASTS